MLDQGLSWNNCVDLVKKVSFVSEEFIHERKTQQNRTT